MGHVTPASQSAGAARQPAASSGGLCSFPSAQPWHGSESFSDVSQRHALHHKSFVNQLTLDQAVFFLVLCNS